MTGQLFVVPVGLPVDPYERVALVLDDGREIRFRDVRKFGRIGLHAADDHPEGDLGLLALPSETGFGLFLRVTASGRVRPTPSPVSPLLQPPRDL